MSANLGNFAKFTLLTGAGWSRNWGAPLAAEVWQMIMDHAGVRANQALLALLREEASFEVALARARRVPFTAADGELFERAVLDAFVSVETSAARAHGKLAPRASRRQQMRQNSPVSCWLLGNTSLIVCAAVLITPFQIS